MKLEVQEQSSSSCVRAVTMAKDHMEKYFSQFGELTDCYMPVLLLLCSLVSASAAPRARWVVYGSCQFYSPLLCPMHQPCTPFASLTQFHVWLLHFHIAILSKTSSSM